MKKIVHAVNLVQLPPSSLPLPVLQLQLLQPQGRPALPAPPLGRHGGLWMPPALSGELGGIHFCYLAGYLLGWSWSLPTRSPVSSDNFWSSPALSLWTQPFLHHVPVCSVSRGGCLPARSCGRPAALALPELLPLRQELVEGRLTHQRSGSHQAFASDSFKYVEKRF